MRILVAPDPEPEPEPDPEPLPAPGSPAAPVRLLAALCGSVLVAEVKENRRTLPNSRRCVSFALASVTALTRIILEILASFKTFLLFLSPASSSCWSSRSCALTGGQAPSRSRRRGPGGGDALPGTPGPVARLRHDVQTERTTRRLVPSASTRV